jgi:hypothetical protein
MIIQIFPFTTRIFYDPKFESKKDYEDENPIFTILKLKQQKYSKDICLPKIGGFLKVNKTTYDIYKFDNKIKDTSYRIHIDVKNKYLKRVYSFFEKLNSI